MTQIGSLKVRAAVNGADRRASYRNLVIAFYANAGDTTPTEQLSLPPSMNPVASTMGQTDPVDREVIQLVEPDGAGYQKVRVTADIRLECSEPGLPLEDAMFTDLYTFV
jgi:hypothetical protein